MTWDNKPVVFIQKIVYKVNKNSDSKVTRNATQEKKGDPRSGKPPAKEHPTLLAQSNPSSSPIPS